jgi:hypothetical protein
MKHEDTIIKFNSIIKFNPILKFNPINKLHISRVPIFSLNKVKNRIKSRVSDDVINYRATLTLRISNLELPVIRKAISAVNRPSFSWFERNFRLNTAVRTGDLVHFSGTAAAASKTTTPVAVSTAAPAAVSTATPVRISSVIKTHFRFTSVYSG